ncbi:MAG: hypothetical protein QOH29_2241 [Actinomycetota bacterium]|jgi:hypothetical protein|nr:hypothetical protein [Actinomycetota bacterium]
MKAQVMSRVVSVVGTLAGLSYVLGAGHKW